MELPLTLQNAALNYEAAEPKQKEVHYASFFNGRMELSTMPMRKIEREARLSHYSTVLGAFEQTLIAMVDAGSMPEPIAQHVLDWTNTIGFKHRVAADTVHATYENFCHHLADVSAQSQEEYLAMCHGANELLSVEEGHA